jgi:hypothetical protein
MRAAIGSLKLRFASRAARRERCSLFVQGFALSSRTQGSEQEMGMFALLTSPHSRLGLESRSLRGPSDGLKIQFEAVRSSPLSARKSFFAKA